MTSLRFGETKAQMLDHRCEIAIIVQQPVAVLDAEGRDDQVGKAFCGNAV
jgi:hypothetical protein